MAIAIIDYCKGNLLSVRRWVEAAGYEAFVTAEPEDIDTADALILPGVGAFKDASDTMTGTGQMEAIRRAVMGDGKPFLGICLGLQLLVSKGDEGCGPGGWAEGIGAFDGICERLPDTCADGARVKVPHVGWNSIETAGAAPSPLLEDVPDGSFFYFTHSYAVNPADFGTVTSYTTYSTRFVSSLAQGNIFGMQFHPEKSSDIGLVVARNFGRIVYPGRG